MTAAFTQNNTAIKQTHNISFKMSLVPNMLDPDIKSEFFWDERTQLYILSADYLGYFPASAVGGWWAENMKPKRVLLIGMALAMIANTLVPAFCVWGWVAAFFVRIVIGFANGIITPSVYKLLSNWAPKQELNIFFIIFTGANFGVLMASYFTFSTVKSFNWKWGFFSVSIVTALWIALSFRSLQNTPRDHKYISESEKTLIMRTTEANMRRRLEAIPYRIIINSIPFWAEVGLHSSYSWFTYVCVTLIPKFLFDIMQMRLNEVRNEFALLSLIRLICEPIIMKTTADFQERKYLSELNTTRLYVLISHVIPGVLVLLCPLFPANRWLLISILISIIMTAFWIPSTTRNAFIVTPKYIGLFVGVSNTIGGMGVFSTIITMAILSDPMKIHSTVWKLLFYIIGTVLSMAGMFFLSFGSVQREPFNDFH